MGGKRKAPEPDTGTANRTGASSSAPDPREINFDDDAPPEAPKWGSDPDALKGPSSQWKLGMINTTNPATGAKTKSCSILHCLPYSMNHKQAEITAAINKVAFGGSCSAVLPPHYSRSPFAML